MAIKYLVLGGSGYVGNALLAELGRRELDYASLSRAQVDYTRVDSLIDYLREIKPQFLINCAGYTGKPNVDACEFDKANCLAGNAALPGIIRIACEDLKIPWGHVSSGCIFAGRRSDGRGFIEEDPPNFSFRQNNCSFYSGTKALGEEVLAGAENLYVWRLRIPFSHIDSPRNYLSKVMTYSRLLDAENSLSNLPEFVSAAIDCFERTVPYGIYNLTNPGSVTTRDVVNSIVQSGVCEKQFRFFKDQLEFMSKAVNAPRSNCVLDSSKAIRAGLSLSPVTTSIEDALRNWQNG